MSRIRLPRQLFPRFPDHFRDLSDWLNFTEPTWGYTIYRTTCTPQSHAAFPRMVDLTTAYIKNGFYGQYESYLRYDPSADKFNRTPFDEMWAKYKPRVIEDASQFDGASIDQVRAHFKAWATERDMLDRFPSYRMFIMIDEESFQTLQNAPLPEDLPQRLEDMQRHYVKVVEALEEDPEPPFPGWMKCSLSGIFDLWPNMQEGAYLEESYSLRPRGTDNITIVIIASTSSNGAFIGFVRSGVGATPPIAEQQAMWWTAFITWYMQMPTDPPHYHLLATKGSRIQYGVDHSRYMSTFAKDFGGASGLLELYRHHGLEILLIYCFGVSCVTIYRLLGPFESSVAPEIARAELAETIFRRGYTGNVFFGVIPMLFYGVVNSVELSLDFIGLLPPKPELEYGELEIKGNV